MSSFIKTMTEIQHRLNARLKDPYTKISVDGSHAPNKTGLCFIIFFRPGTVKSTSSYKLEFVNFKNFRMYRNAPETLTTREEVLAHFENENRLINDIVNQLASGCLKPYLTDTTPVVSANV